MAITVNGQPITGVDLVGQDNANNAVATTHVAANRDGSVLERLEALAGANGYLTKNAPNYLSVTAALDTTTWNSAATHEIFTVSGLVHVRLIAEVTTTGDDTTGDTATIQLGFAGETDNLIAATEVDDLTAGELWYDATPTTSYDTVANVVLERIVNNGIDIGYEIAGEAAVDGAIVFHCWWEPLNATGAVAAGAGGTL